MQKILLLEDDLNLNRGIAMLLSREGYLFFFFFFFLFFFFAFQL